jgi:hypothetical protein
MQQSGRIAFVLLGSLLLAGCAGTTATTETPPGIMIDPDAEVGAVEGRVVDDAVNPIAGAQVGITLDSGILQAVADAQGGFVIPNVPAGRHTIGAIALGYTSAAKSIEVAVGEVTSVTLALVPIPVVEPYVETFGPYQGYFECRMARLGTTGECGWGGGSVPHPTQLYPNDKSIFRFNITSEDYRTFVGDMRWQQGSFATSTAMRLAFSYDKRTSNHWFCSGEGPNPLQWRWEYPDVESSVCTSSQDGADGEPDRPYIKDNPMRAYANVPFGTNTNPVYLSLQQKFDVIVTVFYGEPAPAEFNGFPDA